MSKELLVGILIIAVGIFLCSTMTTNNGDNKILLIIIGITLIVIVYFIYKKNTNEEFGVGSQTYSSLDVYYPNTIDNDPRNLSSGPGTLIPIPHKNKQNYDIINGYWKIIDSTDTNTNIKTTAVYLQQLRDTVLITFYNTQISNKLQLYNYKLSATLTTDRKSFSSPIISGKIHPTGKYRRGLPTIVLTTGAGITTLEKIDMPSKNKYYNSWGDFQYNIPSIIAPQFTVTGDKVGECPSGWMNDEQHICGKYDPNEKPNTFCIKNGTSHISSNNVCSTNKSRNTCKETTVYPCNTTQTVGQSLTNVYAISKITEGECKNIYMNQKVVFYPATKYKASDMSGIRFIIGHKSMGYEFWGVGKNESKATLNVTRGSAPNTYDKNKIDAHIKSQKAQTYWKIIQQTSMQSNCMFSLKSYNINQPDPSYYLETNNDGSVNVSLYGGGSRSQYFIFEKLEDFNGGHVAYIRSVSTNLYLSRSSGDITGFSPNSDVIQLSREPVYWFFKIHK